ncbi:MAG: DUF3048 domain-containing protein [Candidatus Promineifilaceae bacterium]
MIKTTFNVCLFLAFLLLVSCAGEEPEATPIATDTVEAVVDEVAQVDTATATSEPSPTSPPPTETNTPEPTETATSEPTATPTVKPTATTRPTATPKPIVLRTQDEIDEAQRSRLTGELIEDEEVLERRPIICKVSNAPAKYTRPQSGLGSADWVFEHTAEGATRFSALFYSKMPEYVAPIRSARLIDTYLVPMFDSALCFSGASVGVSERLERSTFRARLMRSYYDGYARVERGDVPFEHTMVADIGPFWEWMEEWEHNRNPKSETHMMFSELPPDGGDSAEHARIQYEDWTVVEWDWDAELGRWIRTADDVVATDATTDEEITAANVVILFASHYFDETICDWQLEEVPQRTSDCLVGGLYPDLADDGDYVLLRDGQQFIGRWEGDGKNLLVFNDADGEQIPFQIGNTWVQVVPYSYYETDLIQVE